MRILAVFDIDGVLIDSKKAVYSAYAECVHLTEARFEGLIWGKPWNEAAKALGLSEYEAFQVHEKKARVFAKYAHLLRIDPLAVQMLLNFMGKFDLVIATGGSPDATRIKIRTLPAKVNRVRLLTRVDKRRQAFWKSLMNEYPGRELLVFDDDAETIKEVRLLGGIGVLWTR